ncbi:hypothetical protein BCV69DRAFT_218041 [Microstroma glucosiphilum]|uniref:Uncharacterized protein n=1 Tax=Pseudomicrostroma glucosiphilum TaxID=1684307 RepID=A0A316UAK7_9BASI|nr:hypothetical protein BCV69DRAFT_218041 [Pseudomicrostroma glucosiphilum]PWN20065.1 hypothetical protein BCV69DRAFT_218041 [Pseudomicrostroma glucosiphilum]
MLGLQYQRPSGDQPEGESSSGPFSRARPPQRCYGYFAESSGVKRFRSIVPSSSPIDHLDWRTGATASASQGSTFRHTTQATASSLTRSPDMRSDTSSPLSSPPASPRDPPSPCGSTSSSLLSEPPSSIFDHDSAAKPSWISRDEAASPATSPLASSSQCHSSGKRARGQTLRDPLRGSSSGASEAEPFGFESSAGGRPSRRLRRAPNREPTVLHKAREEIAAVDTSLAASDQASASSSSSAESKWNVWISVSPPSLKPVSQRRRVVKPSARSDDSSSARPTAISATALGKRVGVGRGRTPSTSSESHSALLAQSQSRPEPPENHPGRSKSHAKQQVDSAPSLLRDDGTIEVSYEDEEEDADDVVYELLKGHARKRPKRKLREGGVDEDEVAAFFNDQSAQVAAAKRAGKLAGEKIPYWLPARELPVKSFYARTKREEKSPTPEIRAVQRAQWKITSSVLKSRGATRGVRS